MSKPDVTLVGACGLRCGECEIYIAFTEGDVEKQEEIAESISRQFEAEVGPEQIVCGGCRGPIETSFCVGCKIRPCAEKRGYLTCAECDELESCGFLRAFHSTGLGRPARSNLMEIRKLGLTAWMSKGARGK